MSSPRKRRSRREDSHISIHVSYPRGTTPPVVMVNPRFVEAWTNLGAAQLQTGHVQDAAFSFQQALQWRPGFPPAEAGLRRTRGLR